MDRQYQKRHEIIEATFMDLYLIADFLTDSQSDSSKSTFATWMQNEADSSGWCWLQYQIMLEIDHHDGYELTQLVHRLHNRVIPYRQIA